MTIKNPTADGNQETYQEQYCSSHITGGIQNQLIILSVVNIFLSITALLGNTLTLVALHKESSLHPPSKILVLSRNLATTDLCAGITAGPLIATYWMIVVSERWDICRFAVDTTFIASYMLCSVSLLTLASISVDRLLVLLLGLRYRQVVTLRRTYVIIIFLGVVSIVVSMMSLWNYLISSWYSYTVIPLCLVTSISSYTRIFLTLRHHQTQVQDNIQGQQNQTTHFHIARYKKAVSSAMWLQLTLVLCYLPYNVVGALSIQTERLTPSFYLARQCTNTLVYLNSSINPIIYCWKIREVRQAVKDTIRQLLWSSS